MVTLEMPGIDALEHAFQTISRALPPPAPAAGQQFFALDRVEHALKELREPIEQAQRQGGLLNPWTLMGFKRDEVRIAAALAGLKEHAARFAAQKRDAETKRHNRQMEKLQQQQLKAARANVVPREHRVSSQGSTGVGFWAKTKEIFEMTLGAAVLISVIYTGYSIYKWFQS